MTAPLEEASELNDETVPHPDARSVVAATWALSGALTLLIGWAVWSRTSELMAEGADVPLLRSFFAAASFVPSPLLFLVLLVAVLIVHTHAGARASLPLTAISWFLAVWIPIGAAADFEQAFLFSSFNAFAHVPLAWFALGVLRCRSERSANAVAISGLAFLVPMAVPTFLLAFRQAERRVELTDLLGTFGSLLPSLALVIATAMVWFLRPARAVGFLVFISASTATILAMISVVATESGSDDFRNFYLNHRLGSLSVFAVTAALAWLAYQRCPLGPNGDRSLIGPWIAGWFLFSPAVVIAVINRARAIEEADRRSAVEFDHTVKRWLTIAFWLSLGLTLFVLLAS